MKINDLKCGAMIDHGILTFEDGTRIDLNLIFDTLVDLSEYAENATLEEDDLPQSCLDARELTKKFNQTSQPRTPAI